MSETATDPPMSFPETAAVCREIIDEIAGAVVSPDEVLENLLTGFLARQHVLIEDVPGTGKTLAARSLAGALGLEFNRIQFTPDLLPSDITGSNVFDDQTGTFKLNEGPIFANIVLADEINRAPPKTQAALLEAMEEKQVSIGDQTLDLPDPFFVIATQNPIEQEGTFALPEAQRDRFMIKTSIGYPDYDSEQNLLDRRLARMSSAPSVEQVVTAETPQTLQQVPEYIHVAPEIRDYVLTLGRATREHEATEVGASPRGIQRFLEAARARAVIHGREYVIPEDVKALANPVLAHRLVLRSVAVVEEMAKSDIIDDVIEQPPVPAMEEQSAKP